MEGLQGSLLRATAATGMNKRSSRSHAIFTITLEQRRTLSASANGGAGAAHADEDGDAGDSGDEETAVEDYLCAKMHLVDLAGARFAAGTAALGGAAGTHTGPLHCGREHVLATKHHTRGSCVQRRIQPRPRLTGTAAWSWVVASACMQAR